MQHFGRQTKSIMVFLKVASCGSLNKVFFCLYCSSMQHSKDEDHVNNCFNSQFNTVCDFNIVLFYTQTMCCQNIIFNKAAALGTGPRSTFRNQIMNVANIFIQFAELPTKLMFDCSAASNKKICAGRNRKTTGKQLHFVTKCTSLVYSIKQR